MCKPIVRVKDPLTKQKRKNCPTHRKEKLRKGTGCRICGFGADKK